MGEIVYIFELVFRETFFKITFDYIDKISDIDCAFVIYIKHKGRNYVEASIYTHTHIHTQATTPYPNPQL